jgi:hypothetical protein
MSESQGDAEHPAGPKANAIVEKLVPDPELHSVRIPLKGLLGAAGVPGRWRLYSSKAFNEYIEFDESDLVESDTTALPDGTEGTTIWLKPGTAIRHTTVSSRQVQADFLQGSVTGAFLAQSESGMLANALNRPQTGYACTRNYVCSINPHIPACQTRTDYCGSADCPPNTGALCPTGAFIADC